MGQAISRAKPGKRTFQKVKLPQSPSAAAAPTPVVDSVPEEVIAKDFAKRAIMQSKPHFEQRPDEDVQGLLKELARTVTVHTTKHPYVKIDPKLVRKKLTKEEKLARLEGRLNAGKAGRMFDEVNEAVLRKQPVDVQGIAAQYSVDAQLLQRVLRYNRTPIVKTEQDGSKFALPLSVAMGGGVQDT